MGRAANREKCSISPTPCSLRANRSGRRIGPAAAETGERGAGAFDKLFGLKRGSGVARSSRALPSDNWQSIAYGLRHQPKLSSPWLSNGDILKRVDVARASSGELLVWELMRYDNGDLVEVLVAGRSAESSAAVANHHIDLLIRDGFQLNHPQGAFAFSEAAVATATGLAPRR